MVVGDRPEGPGTAGPTEEQPSAEDGEEVLVDLRRLELSAARRGLALDRVRRALQGEPPHAAFQPIFDLSDGDLVGVEAVARFASRLMPERLVAEARSVGLLVDLELVVLRDAVSQVHALPEQAYLSLNVSAETLTSGRLHGLVEEAPHRLVLELSDRTRVRDADRLAGTVHTLRRLGVRFAIDDVGSGTSNVAPALGLVPDMIKLDASLTRGIDHDPARRSVVGALVAFASAVDAGFVADGIETPGELSVMRRLGADAGQGTLLGKPGRAGDVPRSVRLDPG